MQSNIHNPSTVTVKDYLFLKSDDWRACLEKSFEFLRESWGSQWVGLPILLEYCLDFLNLSFLNGSNEVICILRAAKILALQIEKNATDPFFCKEPKYHNRLHLADALTSMSVLIAIQSKTHSPPQNAWAACALLTAIAHDFCHTGQVNKFESEIELHSVNLLKPILKACNVADYWVLMLEYAIIKSDFTLAPENHAGIEGRSFDGSPEWLAVFLNESDVMASAFDKFGFAMSMSLAAEWKDIGFKGHEFVASLHGRKSFLSKLIFSSESAEHLKIKESIAAELALI